MAKRPLNALPVNRSLGQAIMCLSQQVLGVSTVKEDILYALPGVVFGEQMRF